MNIPHLPTFAQPSVFGDIIGKSRSQAISPAATEAIHFLKMLDATGCHNLVAFDPAKDHGPPIAARTFAAGDWSCIAEFVDRHSGTANLYLTGNEPIENAPHGKLRKEHISRIRAVYADVDPADGVDLDQGRAMLAAQAERLKAGAIPPTMIVDSGGGLQYVWLLAEKLDPTQFLLWAEGQGRALAHELGGDRVQNIDRLLRLPGSPNIPTPKKVEKGRIRRLARIVSADPARTYTPTDLSSAVRPMPKPAAETEEADQRIVAARMAIDESGFETFGTFDDLEPELRKKFVTACDRHPGLRRLWEGDSSARIGDKSDDSSSAWRMSLARWLGDIDIGEDGFDAAEYACLAWIWPHIADSQHKMDARQLARDWAKFGAPEIEKRRLLVEQYREDVLEPPSSKDDQPTSSSADMYPMLSLGDMLSMPDPVFVIDRHLPERSLGFLYGAAGAKKSFIALDWALHLAFGKQDWHGDPIAAKPDGVVIYLAGEGAAGMKVRARAWMQQHRVPAAAQAQGRFRLIPQSVEMMDRENVRKLARTLRVGLGKPVTAIIVDTVSRAMPGADENLQKDMTRFVQACDTLKNEFGCVVVGVHHAGSNGNMRGSTVLRGAGDFVFRMECKSGQLAGRLFCEKMKEAPDGWNNAYRFDVVNLGVDGAGKVVSSLVPSRSGEVEIETGPELTARLFAAMQSAWEAGEPWAKSQHKTKDRGAVRQMVTIFGLKAEQAERLLDLWERTGEIAEEVYDKKSKRKGYRVVEAETDNEGPNSAFE